MKLSLELLRAEAVLTGFRLDMLEKVAHLSHILSVIFANDWLADRLALKGGTALNLFYADLIEAFGGHRPELHRRSGCRNHADGTGAAGEGTGGAAGA